MQFRVKRNTGAHLVGELARILTSQERKFLIKSEACKQEENPLIITSAPGHRPRTKGGAKTRLTRLQPLLNQELFFLKPLFQKLHKRTASKVQPASTHATHTASTWTNSHGPGSAHPGLPLDTDVVECWPN
mmetsp:Transcript_108252/g.186972  ORF Transcript_108252/g.186972 Transcript_108252/m.186972 type:complete len:131 (-) Transcript_108252:3639-4031(-)